MAVPPGQTQLTPDQLIALCALDSELFGRTFFPKTFRQASPPKHKEVWRAFEDKTNRFVNLKAARDFAKTTLSRVYTAKRIAYGLSHTILYVGASEPHASRSVQWLRSAIGTMDPTTGAINPTPFAKVFGLRPGKKWTETELEIYHGIDARPIWVLGVGILGNIRGINFDDYRPDLIYCDDILTDENTATREQRDKITNLVFGALKESLVPATEEPNAKMILAQTPHQIGDVSAKAEEDSSFKTLTMACWTDETMDLSVAQQESAWPERYPSDTLRKEKLAALAGNRYSIFAREKECRLVTRETASFKSSWLKVRNGPAPPMYCVLAIDPVPPPSDRELARSLARKDFEVQAVIGRSKGEYHIIDYVMNQGHEPNWSINTALTLAHRYRVSQIVVETIAYQRVLKYMLEQEMKRRGTYWMVRPYADTRKKFNRITSALAGPASAGRLWIGEDMSEFRLQFETYPSVDHDDVLDAVSIGLSALVSPYLENEAMKIEDFDDDMPEIKFLQRAP